MKTWDAVIGEELVGCVRDSRHGAVILNAVLFPGPGGHVQGPLANFDVANRSASGPAGGPAGSRTSVGGRAIYVAK